MGKDFFVLGWIAKTSDNHYDSVSLVLGYALSEI
jgi:hypothetical protein